MNIEIYKKLFLYFFACNLVLTACKNESGPPRFELLTTDQTGISFQNILEETPQMNIFTYLYFYNEKIDNNFIRLQFKGKAPNHFGTGTKIIIPFGEKKIVQELFPTRGYLSP